MSADAPAPEAAEARPGIRFPFPEPPAPGEAIEVAEGVLWSRVPLPMRLDHVNVYLMDDGPEGWTVIDTGFRGEATQAAWAKLLAGPLSGRPIRRVIVTHHHPDHIGHAGPLVAAGAELWTTRTAYYLGRMLQLDHQETPPEAAIRHYRHGGASAAQIEAYRTRRPFNFSRACEPIPLGFRRLCEGDRITMAGRTWHVHTGNGHAPEHATFWSEDDHLVVTGDQVIPGISSNLGVHPTEPEADPVGEWFESCERLLDLAETRHLALPGHKLPFTGLPTRLEQLIDNHHGALARLRRHLTEPRTAVECFVPIFGREIEAEVFGMALGEALGHLNHMLLIGEAVRETDAAGAWRFRATTAPAI